MVLDFNEISEYPYSCEFSRTEADDNIYTGDKPEDKLILATTCDFQDVSLSKSIKAYDSAKYVVYFPFTGKVPIAFGDKFKIEIYGITITGKVTGIIPNSLSCKCYIADDTTSFVSDDDSSSNDDNDDNGGGYVPPTLD